MGLHAAGLSYRYPGGTEDVLSDVELAVEPGEVLAVVGPSGSGKSTLLRLVCGLLKPLAGTVTIGGSDVTRLPPERRPVAMLFQGFALFPHLTVRDNIAFGPLVRREPRRAVARRVAEVARQLGIEPLLDRRPGELSGGERQRTALARALVRDPAVFCLDEPLSSLDPQLRASARRLLAGVLRDAGRCAVHVTHDQAEAMTVGDRLVVLRDGRVEQAGTPAQVYAEPATAFVAGFLGDPPMNLVTQPDGTTVGIRPEHVRLDASGDPATVLAVEQRGHEHHVEVQLSDGPRLVLRAATHTSAPARGARVRVAVDEAHLARFGPDGRRLP